jgi:hypothetical protein
MVPESSAYAIQTNLPRVGLLMAGDTSYPSYAAFLERLRALGHTEDQTVRMEVRFAEGRLERLPNLASELVALRPDVLAVIGAVSFFAAEKAASAIPIVFSIVLDAIEAGLVSNADRPGGRVTGATSYDPGQVRRQIELLKQAIPNLSRLRCFKRTCASCGERMISSLQCESFTATAPEPFSFWRCPAPALMLARLLRRRMRSACPPCSGATWRGLGRCWPTERVSRPRPSAWRTSWIASCMAQAPEICPLSRSLSHSW